MILGSIGSDSAATYLRDAVTHLRDAVTHLGN